MLSDTSEWHWDCVIAGMTAQPAFHNAYRWLDVGNFERELFKATRVVPLHQLEQLDQVLKKPTDPGKVIQPHRRRDLRSSNPRNNI